MKKATNIATTIIILLFATCNVSAQQNEVKERNKSISRSALNGLHYSVRASYSIGGVSPLPIPAEIRSIDGYRPLVGIALEGTVEKQFTDLIGLHIGLRLENKTMETKARTQNYKMEIENGPGALIKGYWTGTVKTTVKNSYISIPVLMTCKLSPRWKMRVGPYFSYLISGDFYGSVYDGYLREGTPTGAKTVIDSYNPATYNFSDELVRSNWGVQLGIEWRAFSHLNIFIDLQWGLNSVFPDDFETITFNMYPIYANIGFAYAF